MSNIDWSNLRTIDGSQRTGFEKLCCQMASDQNPPDGKRFITKGDGADAGVECFWILEDGSEHAWQAKFFLSSPDANQWSQIDKSVETALRKHPKIVKYTVCLPIDRSDARREKQTSFLDKWNGRVKKWKELASDYGMEVEFHYWGEHEIFKWLSEGPQGRFHYWFTSQYFDGEWFASKLQSAIDLAGPRYTPDFVSNPDLNIELDIARLFEGLSRTSEIIDFLRELHKKLERELYFLNRLPQKISDQATTLSDRWQELNTTLTRVYQSEIHEPVPLTDIIELIRSLTEQTELVEQNLNKDENEEERLGQEIRSFRSVLRQLYEALESDLFQSVNTANLVLLGEAGSGKTHLFCDVAKNRIERGLPTILILGEQFQKNISWQTLIQELHVDLSTDEFLEALNTLGKTRNCRVLIMIDALNESDDYQNWNTRLVQFISAVKEFAYLALAVSIREPYEKVILREDLVTDKRIVKVHHQGFAGYEYEASKKFFQHYEITEPGIPLLNPEFSNPLFLKLFCEAFEKQELDNVKGYRGITSIFERFLSKVNKELSQPAHLDYDADDRVVQQATKILIDKMIEQRSTTLPYKVAQSLINSVYSIHPGYSQSLYKYLLAEGVISEAPIWDYPNDSVEKGTRFAYERFSDHLIAGQLLDQYLDTENPASSFEEGTRLREIFRDDNWHWLATRLISAFAIQIPERTNYEIFELLPEVKKHWKASDAFLESLIWRHWTTDDVPELIIEMLNGKHFTIDHRNVFNVLFSVATDPENPLNAHFLDRNLRHLDMPDRDAHWGILMHEMYDAEYGAIDRLIQWGWSLVDDADLNTESLYLASMTLSWLLISSNRFVRDRATKALVNLYTPRLSRLPELIQHFQDVDDLYIHERLYAVAYGCAMRSNDLDAIQILAQNVYDWIFADGIPPIHILLRDYARGVIDVALHKNIDLNVDHAIFNPPYGSSWIEEPPSMDELKEKYGWRDEEMDDIEYSRTAIVSSVTFIDFGVYIIDTSVSRWTSEPLNADRFKSSDNFLSGLSDDQEDIMLNHNNLDFPAKLAKRWILNRVFDLGWTVERFGVFDRYINRWRYSGRETKKPERFGKKYQWLDLHEFLARLADNFQFKGDSWRDDEEPDYEGKWQIGRRDIDPSHTLKNIAKKNWSDDKQNWWFTVQYDDWNEFETLEEWVKSSSNLPDITRLIEVNHPDEKRKFINLEGHYEWQQPATVIEEIQRKDRGTLLLKLRGYIVKTENLQQMYNWGVKQDYWNKWMPDNHSLHMTECYLGELYWSSAFNYHRPQDQGWVKKQSWPHPVLLPTDSYTQENGYDGSIEDTLRIDVPSKWLVEQMNLRWNPLKGEEGFYNGEQLVAFDPAVSNDGPHAMLVDKAYLTKFLKDNGYAIFWTVVGEKRIMRVPAGSQEQFGYSRINGACSFDGSDLNVKLYTKFQDFRELTD